MDRCNYKLDGAWQIAVMGNEFYFDGGKTIEVTVEVPPLSMLVAFQK